MLVRPAVLAALIMVLVGLAGAAPAASNPQPVGSSYYVVRPDPRLCPSPLCGGYWVSLANHARTRCHDGLFRPRCYVANAIDEHRHPLTTSVADGALARAAIEPREFGGLGELGVLVVAELRSPVGRAAAGDFYRLRDTGVRCTRAQCFSLRASRLDTSSRTTVSDLDLRPARPSPDELERAEAALTTSNGLFASGRIVRTATVDASSAPRSSSSKSRRLAPEDVPSKSNVFLRRAEASDRESKDIAVGEPRVRDEDLPGGVHAL